MEERKMTVFKEISLIDRMRIAGLIISSTHKELFISKLHEIKNELKNVLSIGYVRVHFINSVAVLSYYLKKRQAVARIMISKGKDEKHRLMWDLWPHRFKNSEFEIFHNFVFNKLNNEPAFHYATAYNKGHVSYIEIACDLVDSKIYDYIYWKDKTQKSFIYITNQGEKGAIYLGSKNSDIYFCIYNKAKQLRETGQDTPFKNLLRIEARLRRTNLKPCQLGNLANPFEKLKIASAIDCKKLSVDSLWQHFIHIAKEQGSAQAFSFLNKKERKKYKKLLHLALAKFWKPQIIMNSFDKAIEPIKPENLFSNTSAISV